MLFSGGITDHDHLLRTGGPRADLRIGQGPKVLVDPRIGPGLKAEVDQKTDLDPRVAQNRKGQDLRADQRIDLDPRVAQKQRIESQGLKADLRTVLDRRVPEEADQRATPRVVPDPEVTHAPDPKPPNEPPEIPAVNQMVDPRVGVPPLPTGGRVGLLQGDDLAQGTRLQGWYLVALLTTL